jgi:hypothetical protein
MKKWRFFLTNGQFHSWYVLARADVASAVQKREDPPYSQSGGQEARNWMDEDKPRERDTHSPGSASAKRILGHKNRWPGRRTTPCPPDGALGNFFAAVRP